MSGASVKSWGSVIVTVLVFAAFFAVLAVWLGKIGTNPVKDRQGNIVRDEWQRAKDVMIFVGPFATAALGYWFGSDGKQKAQQAADVAQGKADKAQAQKEAILSAASPDVLERAKAVRPEAFTS
jgi:hypothetical protein